MKISSKGRVSINHLNWNIFCGVETLELYRNSTHKIWSGGKSLSDRLEEK